jgi:hypothetical protein
VRIKKFENKMTHTNKTRKAPKHANHPITDLTAHYSKEQQKTDLISPRIAPIRKTFA